VQITKTKNSCVIQLRTLHSPLMDTNFTACVMCFDSDDIKQAISTTHCFECQWINDEKTIYTVKLMIDMLYTLDVLKQLSTNSPLMTIWSKMTNYKTSDKLTTRTTSWSYLIVEKTLHSGIHKFGLKLQIFLQLLQCCNVKYEAVSMKPSFITHYFCTVIVSFQTAFQDFPISYMNLLI